MPTWLRKLIVILLIVSQVHSTTRASFGEACDKGIRCDSRSSLTCTDGLCVCIKTDEMTFDNKTRKCVVLSSERCSYTAVEILETTQEKRWTEKLDCVENAVCNTDGYCGCASEYFEITEGFCVPKKTYGESCANNDECRSDKKLLCLEGQCSCNKTEAIFDHSNNECAALAGADCLKYNRCVRNAYCPRRQHGYGYYKNDASNNICVCSPQFKKSKKGLCLVTYGGSCHPESAPCSEEWACINDKCQCHFPNHQFINSTAGECVSHVRGPCLENIGLTEEEENNIMSFACVENSECKEDNGINECRCKTGFIENKYKCKIAHGQPCTGQLCDEVANLVCKNGRCSCQDLQIYDDSTMKCRGLIGSKCLLNTTNFCVDGASCDSYRALATDEGICRCVAPMVSGPNRRCTSENSTKKLVSRGVSDDDNDNSIVDNTLESIETAIVLENTLNITEITSSV